jgi:NAD(P)H-flavin reductase
MLVILLYYGEPNSANRLTLSTPLYQIVNHALSDKTNKAKFKLLFSNVTEKDILLREELDALKTKYPNNFDVVYLLDKPEKGWTGRSTRTTPVCAPSMNHTCRSSRIHFCRRHQEARRACIFRE